MTELGHAIRRFGLGPAPVDLSPRVLMATGAAGAVATCLVIAHFGLGGRALVGVLLVAALTILAAIDIEQRVLPNRIVLPSFAVVLVTQLALFPDQAFEWIAASLATALVLLIAALAKSGGLGYGDVKLGLLLGAALGENVVVCLVVGVFAIWPVAVYLYVRHGKEARTMALPFGPFLALGAVVALLSS
jgi:prepilin signal peptidase PulO-like enzyme (type II secretory pathway)